MALSHDKQREDRLTPLAVVVIVVAVLYFASEVILPLALATLLTFLLTTPVAWLELRGLSRIPAVLVTTGATFLVLIGLGWIVGNQLISLSRELPRLKGNVEARFAHLAALGRNQSGFASTVSDISAAITGRPEEVVPGQGPYPVTIVESGGPAALNLLSDWLGPLLAPLGTAAVVLVFVMFMLIQREDLRDRLIRLSGTSRLATTTQALDEAGSRVSRYLFMLLIINGSYGIAVSLGLWLIGLPNPLLWGLLAGTMRFIPYVGPWVAAVLPIALSFANSPTGWTTPGLTVGLFVVLELFSNNVMESPLKTTPTRLPGRCSRSC